MEVLFNSPILMIGYIIVAVLMLYSYLGKVKGYLLPLIALILFVILGIISMLAGVTLSEFGTIGIVFLILNLLAATQKGGEQ